ncbi:MAG: hypothetical protein QNJ32_11810 [Xenococcaceae cyanobacterium MO_167.B27]|nr:hypothetical protein [Xenococcaceae cyanobacterium MO_167.B27]
MPFGSTNFINKSQERLHKIKKEKLNNKSELLLEYTKKKKLNSYSNLHPDSLIGRMIYQAKVISQIITFIWVHGDKGDECYEVANALKEYFTEGNEKKLATLMKANLDDTTPEGKLLLQVFPDIKACDPYYVFPIFALEEVDEDFIAFSIKTNIFSGWIEDVDANNPSTLSAVFAYPPRPQYSDVTVTKAELEDWLKDRDPCNIKSSNIYIPTCTS